jgi:hypothetical protein
LTLSISESPSVGVACLLSEILEHGEVAPQFSLTTLHAEKLLRRVKKYRPAGADIFAEMLERHCSDGRGTKRQNTDLK